MRLHRFAVLACVACASGGALAPAAGAADWSAPIQASDTSLGTATAPVLQFDPAGRAYLTYYNSSFASIVIAPPGKGFGPAFRPPDPNRSILRIGLDFDSAGNAVVIWINDLGQLKAARRSPGPSGTFGPAQTLDSGVDGETMHIDVNAKGEALVGWVKAVPDEVWAAYSPAGAADAATSFGGQKVGDHTSEARSVHPIIDPFAAPGPSAALIWAGDGKPWNAVSANVAAAAPFGTPVALETDPKGPSTVVAASNSAGQAVAVWRYEEGLDPLSPAITTRGAGGSFGAPTELTTDPAALFSAGVGSGGGSAVAWQEQEEGFETCKLGLLSVGRALSPFNGGPAIASSEDFNAHEAGVAVGPEGTVLTAWKISNCASGTNQFEGIQAQFGTGAPHTFFYEKGADAREPEVAFDSFGNAMTVWQATGGQLKASRYVVNEPPAEEPPKEEPPKEEPPPGGGNPPGGDGPSAPDNRVAPGKAKASNADGSVTLTIEVPGPGTLSATSTASVPDSLLSKSTKITVAKKSTTASAKGPVTLKLKPSAKAKKVLKKKGKLKAKTVIEFTPTGGSKGSTIQQVTFKLKK